MNSYAIWNLIQNELNAATLPFRVVFGYIFR